MEAVAALLGYYVLLYLGRASVLAGTMPDYIAAWAPNATFTLIAAILTLRKFRTSVANEPAR
jgi:lipopolysaccharide export LptBFGC system permease protein LptF